MLNVPAADAPESEQGWRAWLAERGLGLVSVADPAGFEWPGPFLGRREGDGWTVLFGVPPGVLFDPSGSGTPGPAFEAMVVAPLTPAIPERAPAVTGEGRVEQIVLSPAAEELPVAVQAARAIAGRGLEGDRYARGEGTFSSGGADGRALTLVEAEVLEQIGLPGPDARRNVVTRGIALNPLVGRRFTIGEVECMGRRLCEPCAHLQRLTRPGVLAELVHRGGLRADILSDGEIAVGSVVRVSKG
jgi:hypothetical protein